MRRLYHLLPAADWNSAGDEPYRAASLESEGFIHCSNADQVDRVANLFYGRADDLLVLEIDVACLASAVRDEDVGTGELFPHVYGPIDQSAVAAVMRMIRDSQGQWRMPGGAKA